MAFPTPKTSAPTLTDILLAIDTLTTAINNLRADLISHDHGGGNSYATATFDIGGSAKTLTGTPSSGVLTNTLGIPSIS